MNQRILPIGLILIAAQAARGDVTVDASGKGDFNTVQEAVDAVPKDNAQPFRIFIQPGTYKQQITISAQKKFVQFIGKGDKPEQTIITFNLKSSDPKTGGGNVGTSGSSSVFVHGDDFLAENITFENSAGDNVGQAVALKTTADRLVFRNCRFLGFQDTLYPTGGRDYFDHCYITGDTDFIFGNATAVFDHCTINSTDFGYITAANTKPDRAHGYVFLDCTLTAGANVKPGTVYLGRPWQWDRGSSASVAFIRTTMGPAISPAGWHPWDVKGNTDPGKNTRYAETGSVDEKGKPIDTTARVKWAKPIENIEDYTPAKILAGDDNWDPTKK